jgi:hypothetical protein
MSRLVVFLSVACLSLSLCSILNAAAQGGAAGAAAEAPAVAPATAPTPAAEATAPAEISSMENLTREITFEKVIEGLDPRKNTQLFVQQFWKNIRGKELTTSGEVIDVRPAKGQAEVDVANKSKPTVERINLRLIVPSLDQAAVLKRGQQIKFKGAIDNYKDYRGGGIVVTLKNVELLP